MKSSDSALLSSIAVMFLFLFKDSALALKLKNVTIPPYGSLGGFVKLGCDFDMESDKLLSVKWYKGDDEFFKYVPKTPGLPSSPLMKHPVNGVYVDLSQSGMNVVTLQNITLETEGTYKCEVSADRPTFKTLSSSSDLFVIAPPKEKPRITGLKDVTSVGELLQANCTCRGTKPAASLMFYINNFKMDNGEVLEYPPEPTSDGLQTSTLGFKIRVEPTHFSTSGVIEVKCTATIGNGYWESKKSVGDARINAQYSAPGGLRVSSSAAATSSNLAGFTTFSSAVGGHLVSWALASALTSTGASFC